MKNYFISEERTRHIILLAMQEVAEDFGKSDALTDDERKYIKTATTYIKKFNASVYDRFGDPYKRKIENTMKRNDLKLVGKYAPSRDCISEAAQEDLIPMIREIQSIYCMDCEKNDHKACAMYAMCTSCGIDGGDTDDCPYKI